MASASPQRYGQRCQVLELDHFMAPRQLEGDERAYTARRYLTLLLIQGDENSSGGTGKAIKVFNCFGEPICLKSLKPVMGYGGRAAERARVFEARSKAFALEYDCHSTLSDIPGIPLVYGYGSYGGGPVMLMEWVHGCSLRSALLPRAKQLASGLSMRLLSAVGASVAGVLRAARERDPQFVHRDLSGMNVLIATSQEPLKQQIASCLFDLRLIDFGSAMSESIVTAREAAGTDSQRIWRNATPEYAPPEMLTHRDPGLVGLRGSASIDVYELCGVLFELYCGVTPYRLSENKPQTAYLYKLENRPAMPQLRRQADGPFVELILQGLEADQARRPSIGEFRERMIGICRANDDALADALDARHEEALAIARTAPVRGATDLSPKVSRA